MSVNVDVANLPREAIERLMQLAPSQGRVVIAHAFGDFRREDMDDLAVELYQYGFRLIHCPAWPNQRGRLKSVVDDVMAQDLRDQLEYAPDLEVFIIGSGDRNFIAVANALKRHGKRIVVAADQESINRELRLCADEYMPLPRGRGGRPQPQQQLPEQEPYLPTTEEVLEQVRRLATSTDYLTLRRIVRALVPDGTSNAERVRSMVSGRVQELIDLGQMRTERRTIRGRGVNTLVIAEGNGISPNGGGPEVGAQAEASFAPPATRRRPRRRSGAAAAS